MALAAHHPFRSPQAKRKYLRFYDQLAEQWPSTSSARFMSTTFGQTFVRIQGPVDGPPLVLLPGDTETSLSWLPVIEQLSSRFRTYAIDHIFDNGRSIYTKKMSCSKDFVDWLDELFDALRLDRLNLVAYSYGAWQAALYALAYPDRIKKLVLLAPSSTVLSPGLSILARAILYYVLPFRFITKNYFYWYGPDAVKDEKLRARVDEMIEEDLLARRCFKRRIFIQPTLLTDVQWGELQVDTLFLIGENDKTYPAELALQRLRDVAPSVTSKIAPDTDHYITLTNPNWVVQNVMRFLAPAKDKTLTDPEEITSGRS